LWNPTLRLRSGQALSQSAPKMRLLRFVVASVGSRNDKGQHDRNLVANGLRDDTRYHRNQLRPNGSARTRPFRCKIIGDFPSNTHETNCNFPAAAYAHADSSSGRGAARESRCGRKRQRSEEGVQAIPEIREEAVQAAAETNEEKSEGAEKSRETPETSLDRFSVKKSNPPQDQTPESLAKSQFARGSIGIDHAIPPD